LGGDGPGKAGIAISKGKASSVFQKKVFISMGRGDSLTEGEGKRVVSRQNEPAGYLQREVNGTTGAKKFLKRLIAKEKNVEEGSP